MTGHRQTRPLQLKGSEDRSVEAMLHEHSGKSDDFTGNEKGLTTLGG